MGALPETQDLAAQRIWALLAEVPDPEIPVLSITDLGIVRHVRADASGALVVGLTPTYSGCPATEAIRAAVRDALDAHGFGAVRIEEVLSPAWSSAWLSARGRGRLREFGIAPPEAAVTSPRQLRPAPLPACPRCGSRDSERLSEFGSTPCKAHYRCNACREPFDYFKCI
ncbi:MAG: phenylacetate-CoA oxygenase subunit PaaJ [Proteobacteria bacterium]|nr:phenylacetate-CoA oxygenase subunit PaaJ [Pseudomonadota bacterium]